ncbi:proline-rich protein HaeIII subfamily 1-like isoform X2 [Belonocnema kinseyi]|uniref:proline-rich protein HaeIII subfamily 1-like isoform X2 n=1 Tax=Belonocnema kinseyi TaxID=2817044 RepID=UPI00143CD55A|nr:proline-rich protein HaeIII subfamily 1-like isoform X2 [Belonocnema kinseyi]
MAQNIALIFALAIIQVIYSDAQILEKEFSITPYRSACASSPCAFPAFGWQQMCRPIMMPPIPIGGMPIGGQPSLEAPIGISPPMGVSPPLRGPIGIPPSIGTQPTPGFPPLNGNSPQMQGPPASFIQPKNLNENSNKNFNLNTNTNFQ